MLGIEDVGSYLTRLTWDGLPRNRRVVLKAIHKIESEDRQPIPDDSITNVSQWAIAKYSSMIEEDGNTGLSQPTVRLVLNDLTILKIKELPWRKYLCSGGFTL